MPTGSHLQHTEAKEHKFIFTVKRSTNGRRFNVRCKCMAEYRNVSDRYFNYDILGEVSTIIEAVQLWTQHMKDEGAL